MIKRNAFSGGLAALGFLVLAAGCGRDREGGAAAEGEAGGAPEAGGTAIVAELADISLPLAVLAETQLDGDLSADVLSVELVRPSWDSERGELVYKTADQSPVALARSYEYVGPDSATLRFRMRSDMKWSDGRPITARDVAYTYELVRNPDVASPRQDHVQNLDSVAVENDSTVRFHFKRRYPQMLGDASLPPTPRHVFQGADPKQIRTHPALLNPAGGKLVTSGPWMIGQWEKGQRVVLVPNPHFRPQPRLSQLVFRVIPEPTTRIVEVQSGGVDMIKAVATDQIPALKANPELRLEREAKRAYDYIAYSGKGFAPFRDPEVRQALSMAIDNQRLLLGLQLQDYGAVASGPYAPVSKMYDPKLMPTLPHDPQRARQILESKGWRDSDGDGVLDKDGKPFRFTLVTTGGNQRRADASQIVQQQWKQIGVDAQLETQEFNTYMGRIRKQDFQAALGGWVTGLQPDYMTVMFGSGAPMNITGYSNPQVDALFKQAQVQPTDEAARPLWQQAAAKIVQDQPYTWLYYVDFVDPVRSRLKNTKIDTYGPYQNTWEWWIPRGQQRGGAPAAGAQQDSAR